MSKPVALVVDDDPGVLRVLRFWLRQFGCSAVVAETGEQALELYREYRPPVVVADVGLPGMDGTQLAEAIRAEAPAPPTVYLMSVSPPPPNAHLGDGFFSKPEQLTDLLRSVSIALGSPLRTQSL